MPGAAKDLKNQEKTSLPDGSGFRIGIIVAEWNSEITEALYQGAFSALRECGVPEKEILRLSVPGSFELITGARWMVENEKVHAVVCLGCLIRGETPHFDFIGNAVSNGLVMLAVRYSLPFIFGVLTTNTFSQATARAGGKLGNKGSEAALTAVKMAGLKNQLGGGTQIGFSTTA